MKGFLNKDVRIELPIWMAIVIVIFICVEQVVRTFLAPTLFNWGISVIEIGTLVYTTVRLWQAYKMYKKYREDEDGEDEDDDWKDHGPRSPTPTSREPVHQN